MSDKWEVLKVRLDDRLFKEAVCGAPAPEISSETLQYLIQNFDEGAELLREFARCSKEGAGTVIVALRDGKPVDVIPSCDEKGSVSFNEYWRLTQKLRENSLGDKEPEQDPRKKELWQEILALLNRIPEESEKDGLESTRELMGKFDEIKQIDRDRENQHLQISLAPKLLPLAESGVKHRLTQKSKRSKRQTWHGKSAQEIEQRNAQIIEDYKKAKAKNSQVTPHGFASQNCKKYGLKVRQTRMIIESNLPS